MRVLKLLMASALALALLPATANAQEGWLFTPYLGANFGGMPTGEFNDFDDEFERESISVHLLVGWALECRCRTGLRLLTEFFRGHRRTGDFEFGDSNVTTLMGNILVGVPSVGSPASGRMDRADSD